MLTDERKAQLIVEHDAWLECKKRKGRRIDRLARKMLRAEKRRDAREGTYPWLTPIERIAHRERQRMYRLMQSNTRSTREAH